GKIVRERGQSLLAVFRARPAHHNQILRAGNRAQVAGDAQRLARFGMIVQAWRAPIAFRHRRPLQGILLRVSGVRTLIGKRQPQAFDQVDQKYPPEKIFPVHLPNPTRPQEGGSSTTEPRPVSAILPESAQPERYLQYDEGPKT